MTKAIPTSSRLAKTVTIGTNGPHPQTIHRIALAPLTRYRNEKGTQAPQETLGVPYYQQRASKGGLLITEATFISEKAGGYALAPGIHSEKQVQQWKKVTDAVHSKGGLIYCQFWALGRANGGAQPEIEVIGASPIGLKDHPVPREMSTEEVEAFILDYGKAAKCALEAGFDGVELHGANGYLVDQFTQACSNKRTDKFGGSQEKRNTFGLAALEQIINVFGPERVGIRISPWGRFQEMLDEDPYATFIPYVTAIVKKWPNFGYIHLTEARNWTGVANTTFPTEGIFESNDPFRAVIRGVDLSKYSSPTEYAKTEPRTEDPSKESPIVILSAAGHTAENIEEFVEKTGDVAVFGRFFIANPDLPERIFKGHPITPYDRNTFYTQDAHGYIDYPTWEEEQQQKQSKI